MRNPGVSHYRNDIDYEALKYTQNAVGLRLTFVHLHCPYPRAQNVPMAEQLQHYAANLLLVGSNPVDNRVCGI